VGKAKLIKEREAQSLNKHTIPHWILSNADTYCTASVSHVGHITCKQRQYIRGGTDKSL